MLEKLLRDAGKAIPRPFGIYLSGGMDSGVLAALLKPDFALTLNFDGEYYRELDFAKATAEYLGIKHFVVEPNGEDFKEVVAKVLEILQAEKPIGSVSIYPWYKIINAAMALKPVAMVGGEGSDETFGGYSRYIILQKLKEIYDTESLAGYKPMLDSLLGSLTQVHSKMCGVSCETLEKRYAEKEGGFLTKVGWAEFNESLPPLVNMEKKLHEYFKIPFYLPFYDEKVQEYGWSLKDNERVKGEIRKVKVYQLAKKYLPEKVWNRKDKKGFVSPCNEWAGSKDKYDKTAYLKMQDDIINNSYS